MVTEILSMIRKKFWSWYIMKILGWIVAPIIVLGALVYGVVFTPFGNDASITFLEKQIQRYTKLTMHLKTYRLTPSTIDIEVQITPKNFVHIVGSYNILEQSVNLQYDLKLDDLEALEPLVGVAMQDTLATNGTLKGTLQKVHIDGVSDLAKSDTQYHVVLENNEVRSLIATMKHTDLFALLHMFKQKHYADATLDMDLNFKDLHAGMLDGDVHVTSTDGVFNSKVLRKDFGIKVPKTTFQMDMDAKLDKKDTTYTLTFDSNLAHIASSGVVATAPLRVDAKYRCNIQELALLQPLTHADIRGAVKLHGTLKGTQKDMKVVLQSDLASSKTTLHAQLKDMQPKDIRLRVQSLDIAKLLYMVKQPAYAKGVLDMDAHITDLRKGLLAGDIDTKVRHGVLNSRYFTKLYKFASPMPKTTFRLDARTKLHKNQANTQLKLNSSLADIQLKDAQYKLDTQTFFTHYSVDVQRLNDLYFLTQRRIKGGIKGSGTLQKGDDLDITFTSHIAQGMMKAQMHNTAIHADITKMQTFDLLDMLYYPTVLRAGIDAKITYDTALQKGRVDGVISHGKFTPNSLLDATKKYAHIDLYKQRFKGEVTANIHKEHILAALDLRSNTSSIKTTNAKIDTKHATIESVVDIVANKHPLRVTLQGAIKKPKVQIDAHELIEQEAAKALKKQLQKHHIDPKDVGKLLKGLF